MGGTSSLRFENSMVSVLLTWYQLVSAQVGANAQRTHTGRVCLCPLVGCAHFATQSESFISSAV